MCSRVLVLLLLAMCRNHGTMGFVFGPLAAFTSPQDASSPAPSASTLQWSLGTDATTVSTTTTTTTTTIKPFIRRRPPSNRRRPVHGNIIFPTDDNFSSFADQKNPILNSQDNKDNSVLTHDRGSDSTEQRFFPGLTPRPIRTKHDSQETDDAIFFDGPSSLPTVGDRGRVNPPGRPPVFESTSVGSDVGGRRRVIPPRRPGPMVFGSPDMAPDVATPGLPPDFPSPPTPCPCPTTSESNPVCAEIQGARVTMSNLSEFKCAQMCVGATDVKLLFLASCQKTIHKLIPFIHD